MRPHFIFLSRQVRDFAFWRDVFAEFLATFLLICVQTGLSIDWSTTRTATAASAAGATVAIANRSSTTTLPMNRQADFPSDGALFRLSVGTCLVATALLWIFRRYGGCLMNPAVTLAFVVGLRITFHKGPVKQATASA